MPTNIGGVALGDLILGAETTSVYNRSVTSTLAFTQTIGHNNEAMVQTITFNQTIAYSRVFNRTVTSTIAYTQHIAHTNEAMTQTITFGQTIGWTKYKVQNVNQTLPITHTVLGTCVRSRLIVQGLNFTHTRDYDAVFRRSASNTLSLTQTIVGNKCKTVTSTFVCGQTIAYTKCKLVKHTLEWQQSFIYPTTFRRSINTVLGLSQQISLTKKSNKTVGQNLTFTQTIVQARVKGVSQTLSLSQTIVAYASRGVANTLALSQAIRVQMVYNRLINTPLVWESDNLLNRSVAKEVHHGFGMNSIVRKSKVNSLTIAQSLTVSQQIRFNVYRRTVSQTLSLTQTVGYKPVYPRAVTSSLQFNQTVGKAQTIVRSVVSTLAFLPVRQVYVGMGGVDYIGIENLQYAHVPSYLVGKKNRPMCVLQVKNAVITLPAPEFGDGEAYGGVFTIRRSMNNIPYTHVRTLSLRKLNLPFVLAKRKAWELREFLIQNNPELMTLTTWKGDKWFVNLTTNPLELRVSGKYSNEDEKVSIELEFEGLKVM